MTLVARLVALFSIAVSVFATTQAWARQAAEDENTIALRVAAIADARERLAEDIRATPIPTAGMTVDDFVRKSGGDERFAALIQKAEQIGGPREIGNEICQVRIELPGDRVAQCLVEIAAAHADRSPIKSEVLAKDLADWKNTRFSKLGTGRRPGRANALPPNGPNDKWRVVDDKTRQKAIEEAKADAVKQVLKSIAAIPIGDKTAGDIIQDADPVRVSLEKWLRDQPFSNIQLRDDMRVAYTLSASGTQLFDQFVNATRQAKIPDVIMMDQQAFAAAQENFGRRVLPTTGTNEGGIIAARTEPPVVPADPPDWVSRQIDGAGQATAQDSPLRTKQAAEDVASQAITAKLQALPLTTNETVGDVMKRDPMVREAVRKAVSRATTSKVAIAADGSVSVRMVLPGSVFWEALTSP